MTTQTLLTGSLASLALTVALNSWASPNDATPTSQAPMPSSRVLPLWEMGIATGAGYVPDYPGSDRARARAAILPILIYRGPLLRIENGSIYGRIKQTSNWELNLSANGAFNANNNADRQGMPDLDYLFGLGPQLIYRGWQDQPGSPTLRMKLRAIMSTDLQRIDQRGTSFEPELQWRIARIADTPATLSLSIQPGWGSQSLQSYFYQVNTEEATAARPAFTARAGYMGTEAGLTLTHKPQPDFSWFITARLLSLHGTANRHSPLLRDNSNFSIGAGVVWTPWRSSATASK